MKQLLLIVAVLALGAMVFSVTGAKADQKWQAGVKVGGTGAKLAGDQVGLFLSIPYKFQVQGAVGDKAYGFTGGAYIKRAFSDMFTLQLEALYTQKGGTGNVYGSIQVKDENSIYQDGEIDGVMTVSLDYIELPLLAIFTFPADDKWTLFGVAGASFGFTARSVVNLAGTVTFPQPSGTKIINNFDETYSLTSVINSFDMGGVIGGGVEVKAGDVQLIFDARYTFGLTKVNKEGDDAVRNSVVSMFVGAGIPFGSDE